MRSRKKTKNEIAFENIFALTGMLFIIFTIIYSSFSQADEMKFTFKSPSFSGIATSAHYLTIENQENTRKQKEYYEKNKEVISEKSKRISLKGYPNGIYNMTIIYDEIRFNKRVIKQ